MDERTTDRTGDSQVSEAQDTWHLSAREAAAVLGVSDRTVRRAIARGDLPATRHAGVYRIAAADLARYRACRPVDFSPSTRTVLSPPRLIPLPKREEAAPDLPRPLTPLIGREREL